MSGELGRTASRGGGTPDRGARAFVWSVWLVMFVACVVSLALYARDVPLTEGWQLVPSLTGNEPDLLRSLWAQNNEHRIPFPRLVLLALLEASGGDFRAGMVLNIGMLAIVSAAFVRLARSVRGGRTRYADAVFPVALLHLGHWNNLYWGWQVTQVLPSILVLVVLHELIRNPGLEGGLRQIGLMAASVVLLPLCGANGLVFAPFFALWIAYLGLSRLRIDGAGGAEVRNGAILVGAGAFALALTGLYFVGYQRPDWVPPNPGVLPSLVAAAQFTALAVGPVARTSWILSIGFVLALLASGALLAAETAIRAPDAERRRAIGITVFVAACAVFAAAMGWGRAGVVAVDQTWPGRYAIFGVPALVGAYFIWELYGRPGGRVLVQSAMFVCLLLLVPLNTQHGLWFRDWYVAGADAVVEDLHRGATAEELAMAHGSWLDHTAEPALLEARIEMLAQAGMGPWEALGRSRDSAPDAGVASSGEVGGGPLIPVTVRYEPRDAERVVLVWGIEGWRPLDERDLPIGTDIREGVMHTPMTETDRGFSVTIPAPRGATVDYGFLLERGPAGAEESVWDGDYAGVPEPSMPLLSVVAPPAPAMPPAGTEFVSEVTPEDDERPEAEDRTLVPVTFVYGQPGAGAVDLIWGVDGWQTVPAAVEPGVTEIHDLNMRTAMSREGDAFTATVHAPRGAAVDFGFLTTDRSGILDLEEPRWDWREGFLHVVDDGSAVLEIDGPPLRDALSETVAAWRGWAATIAGWLGIWALAFVVLGSGPIDQRRYTRT